MNPLALLAVVSALTLGVALAPAADWPQFRGPGATGRCPDAEPLPVDFGPDAGIVWKVPVPPGHSCPAVVGDRIYLTAVRDKKQLLTIALVRHLLGRRSEAGFLHEVGRDWAQLFPHLPHQSEANRRTRWLWAAFEQCAWS